MFHRNDHRYGISGCSTLRIVDRPVASTRKGPEGPRRCHGYDELAKWEMVRAMQTGQPYQTRLDPPPGPLADANGNFLLLPQWLLGQPHPANWPPHIHAPREITTWEVQE